MSASHQPVGSALAVLIQYPGKQDRDEFDFDIRRKPVEPFQAEVSKGTDAVNGEQYLHGMHSAGS